MHQDRLGAIWLESISPDKDQRHLMDKGLHSSQHRARPCWAVAATARPAGQHRDCFSSLLSTKEIAPKILCPVLVSPAQSSDLQEQVLWVASMVRGKEGAERLHRGAHRKVEK